MTESQINKRREYLVAIERCLLVAPTHRDANDEKRQILDSGIAEIRSDLSKCQTIDDYQTTLYGIEAILSVALYNQEVQTLAEDLAKEIVAAIEKHRIRQFYEEKLAKIRTDAPKYWTIKQCMEALCKIETMLSLAPDYHGTNISER